MMVDVTTFIYHAKIEYFFNWFWNIEETFCEFMRLKFPKMGIVKSRKSRLLVQIIYISVIISFWANSVMPLSVYGR